MLVVALLVMTGVYSEPIGNPYDVDYLTLMVSWPPGLCMFETCESEFEVEGFFIHGLWPNRKSGDHPSYCAEMFMDRPPLPTKLKLMQNWKALHGDNTALWRHEWKKHGTCITQTSDDYFNLALRLFEEHPVMPRLEKFKLKPSIQTFTKTTLAKSYFRKNVELHCKKTYLGTVLTEVGLCFTLDGKAIDCPYDKSETAKAKHNSCGESFLWRSKPGKKRDL